MYEYNLATNPPPPDVAGDLHNSTKRCTKCHRVLTITTQVLVTVQ